MTPIGHPEPSQESRSASTQLPAASVGATPPLQSLRATTRAQPIVALPALLATIRTLGGILDDLERVRIMATNRVGAMEARHGSSVPHLDVILDPVRAAEHQAELELIRAWRLHPLASWAKNLHGVGEKSIARLIAHIGDPGVRSLGEWRGAGRDRKWIITGYEPRTVSQLWAFCGLGDPARKRRKGMTQEEALGLGNPAAKRQCWLIGEAFVMVRSSPYRMVYDAAREKYADRVHAKECAPCGPSGTPAAVGTPWSLKHQLEAAKRKAVKEFLKDLWVASRHESPDAFGSPAGGAK